jgi:hypothetical protein
LINWLFPHIIIFEEVFYFNFHFSPPSNLISLPHQPRSHTHHAPVISNFICHLLISRKSQVFDSTQLHLLKKKKKNQITHSKPLESTQSFWVNSFSHPRSHALAPLIFSFFFWKDKTVRWSSFFLVLMFFISLFNLTPPLPLSVLQFSRESSSSICL